MRRSMLVVPLFAVAVFVLGCGGPAGPPLGNVKGKITLDGKPLAGATVTFVGPDNVNSVGTTSEDGSYTLEFIQGGKAYAGAPVGENKVAVVKFSGGGGAAGDASDPAKMGEMMKNMTESQKLAVPQKYTVPAQSGLTANVKAGENEFNFDLKSQ